MFTTKEPKEIDLFQFCRSVMYKASCFAVFGPDFPCDAIKDDYAIFEASISSYMRRYPRLLEREGYAAREKVLGHLAEYLSDDSKTSRASKLIVTHLKVCYSISETVC